jgi:hypothetical protein
MRHDFETWDHCLWGESIQYVFRAGTHELSQYLFEQLFQLLSTTKIGCSLIGIMTPVFNMSRQIFKIMCRHIEIPLPPSLPVTKTLTLPL